MTARIGIATAAIAVAITASPASASAGLVGQWRLNDGAGTVAVDSSGYGDNGTLVGGANWVTSPTGGALSFDGASGRITIPDASQLEPASVTVSAWIERAGSPGAFRYIVAKGATGCIAASYGLYSGPDGGLQFYVSRQRGTTYARSPDAGAAVWDGNWHLVVGTFDGTTIRLYVDGIEAGSGTPYPGELEYVLPGSNDLYIGDYPGCNAKNFLGGIADVEIWSRALSADEVSAIVRPSAQPPLPTVNPSRGVGPTAQGAPAQGQGGSNPPILRVLKLSRSTFPRDAIARRSTITYTDSQSAHVTFAILKLVPNGRCVKNARGGSARPARHCPRYIRIGGFAHDDHPGRNALHFPRRLRLAPATYVLKATPSAGGVAGATIGVGFTVVG